MPRLTSFSFTKILPKESKEPKYHVSIKQDGSLTLSKPFVTMYGNESLVEFMADNNKKVIGFRKIITESPQHLEEVKEKLPNSRVIKLTSTGSGCQSINIKRILDDVDWYRLDKNKRIMLCHHEIKFGLDKADIWYFDPFREDVREEKEKTGGFLD